MFFQATVRISIQVDRDKVKLIKVKERILTPIRTGVSLNNNFREQDLKVGVKVECSSKVKDKMCRIEMLEDSTDDKKQQ